MSGFELRVEHKTTQTQVSRGVRQVTGSTTEVQRVLACPTFVPGDYFCCILRHC